MDSFARNFLSNYLKSIRKAPPEDLLKLLSALEYCGGILEMSAGKLFGQKFKWFIVWIAELTKFVTKLLLLIVHKIGLQPLPSLFNIKGFLNTNTDIVRRPNDIARDEQAAASVFKLQHSNRSIRSIQNSPNIQERDWIVPNKNSGAGGANLNDSDVGKVEKKFDPSHNNIHWLGELLYISRPICHLVTISLVDNKSWSQFFIPLVIDLMSMLLLKDAKNLNKDQQKELKRRTYLFLRYFLRSPLYDKYSMSMIHIFFSQIEQIIPGIHYLTKYLKDYIVQWRSIYAYCWSS